MNNSQKEKQRIFFLQPIVTLFEKILKPSDAYPVIYYKKGYQNKRMEKYFDKPFS